MIEQEKRIEPARMRTINEALAEIKRCDSQSSLTYNFIKKLCDNKAIKHIKNGRKYFVNLDDLFQYISN